MSQVPAGVFKRGGGPVKVRVKAYLHLYGDSAIALREAVESILVPLEASDDADREVETGEVGAAELHEVGHDLDPDDLSAMPSVILSVLAALTVTVAPDTTTYVVLNHGRFTGDLANAYTTVAASIFTASSAGSGFAMKYP
mgnify:CR=1 FL=1